jgi:hypothetical protein
VDHNSNRTFDAKKKQIRIMIISTVATEAAAGNQKERLTSFPVT